MLSDTLTSLHRHFAGWAAIGVHLDPAACGILRDTLHAAATEAALLERQPVPPAGAITALPAGVVDIATARASRAQDRALRRTGDWGVA